MAGLAKEVYEKGIEDQMPFKSEAQRKALFAKEPAVAKKWTEEAKKVTPKSVEERREEARKAALKKRLENKSLDK